MRFSRVGIEFGYLWEYYMTERERDFSFTDFFLLLRRRVRIILGCAIILAIFMTFVALADQPVYQARGLIQVSNENSMLGIISQISNLGSVGGGGVTSEVEIIRSQTIADTVIDQCALNMGITDVTWGNPLSKAVNFVIKDGRKRGLRTLRLSEVEFPSRSINEKYFLSVTDSDGGFILSAADGRELGSGQVGEVFSSEELTFTVDSITGPPGTRFRLKPADPYDAMKGYRDNLRASMAGGSLGSNLVKVYFSANDPTLASDVVNAIIAEYERLNKEWLSSTGSTQTSDLQARLDEATIQLHDSEDALNEYKNQAGVVALPEEARLAVTELSTREAQKVDLNLKLSLWESIYNSLAGQLHGDGFLIPPVLTDDPVIEQLASDHARITLEIQDLLLDYTESHPLVIAKRENMQSVRQNILDILSATIAGLRAQLSDINSVISTFENRLYAIPDVERDMVELTRNMEVAEEIYILISKRLEEARIFESSFNIGNRVIDHATPPLRPDAPSIRRNLLMGLGIGLVLGIFLAFLIEVTDPRLRRPEQIARFLNGSPVLSISRRSNKDIKKAAGAIALAVIKCRNERDPVSIGFVCPGAESGYIRGFIEELLSELSQGIHPVFLVDTSSQEAGFFGTGMEPGISEIADGKSVQLQTSQNGRLLILPSGSDPSTTYVSNPAVTDFVREKLNQAGLGLYHVPNFANDPVLRGWTSMSCGAILVLRRNHELIQDIFESIEALESDKTRLLATLIID